MSDRISVEQLARDMLDRMGVDDAQEWTAGRLVELANLISKADALEAMQKENEQLEAQCESLQNKCAQRGLSPEDSDVLEARVAELESALREIADWFEAYPEDMFTPLQGNPIKKTGDYDTDEKRNLITRASAAMARHMIERIQEKIKQALKEQDDA